MSTSKLSPQSAAARRSAEAELGALIVRYSPGNQRLVAAARKWLLTRLPTAHEIVYEYRDCFVISCSPSERGYEGVFAVRGSEEGVRLYLNRGKGLPDPAKLLRGTAQARWIDLESASTLARPEVASLVDEAIARNRVPFPPTGRGKIVIQTKRTKKRTKKRTTKRVAKG